MQKKLVVVCLVNFLIATLMGLALRYNAIEPIGINYRFLTHGHSHVAMLGWVYLMLFTLIVHYFIPDKKPIYNRLFWITEFAVIGMMVSFPLQGYAAVSITFSTLHILCSYYFVYLIWKHHKTKSKATGLLLRASLFFMVLSTLGVWCLGPAVSMLGQASAFYQIAIQFFLHFQFNGWFIIAALAVFFHILKIRHSKQFRLFFRLLIASTVFTLAMPINWYAPHAILTWINGIAVVLQIMALAVFLKLIKPKLPEVLDNHSKLIVYVYSFAIFCFVLKIGLQLLSLFPEVSAIAYQYRNLVIGFIHLTMLGVISGFLLSFVFQSKLVTINRSLYLSTFIFIIGFVFTEGLLTIQGALFYLGHGLMANYYLYLFIASLLLPLGIIGFIINSLKSRTYGA